MQKLKLFFYLHLGLPTFYVSSGRKMYFILEILSFTYLFVTVLQAAWNRVFEDLIGT
jgi:hypothetical protein